MKLCHCHTPDCPNDGVPFTWDDTPPEGDVVTVVPPWCGGCSTEFADITDDESTGS